MEKIKIYRVGEGMVQKERLKPVWAVLTDVRVEILSEMAVSLFFSQKLISPTLTEAEEDVAGNPADTAIYVISRNSGEGADRFAKEGDYLPFREEIEQITFLTGHFSKVVLLLNIGGVMDLSGLREIPGLGAILLVSQLGNLGGQAIADVLLGKATPSGKTTDTWAKAYMDYPSSEKFSHNESVHDELYEDGIYVGYRYFDSFEVAPLYPFGYGRSYTEFSLSAANMELDQDKIRVEVQVQNTGKEYAGKEVVQAYVSMVESDLDLPYQKLVALRRQTS